MIFYKVRRQLDAEAGEGMEWMEALGWCHCYSDQGAGSTVTHQDPPPCSYLWSCGLPVPTSGGAGLEPFPRHPHKFRTSSLRSMLKDNEIGLKVIYSPLQQVEGGSFLLRADLMKT